MSELETIAKTNTRILFAGIFLAALSSLVLEIAITRIFSAAIWYHFAFVAVSLALVGLGSSGLLVHSRFKKSKGWAGNLTISSAIGVSMILPITLFVMHSLVSNVLYLPLFMFMFAIPFFFLGIIISTAFNSFAQKAGRLYASDLIGAAIGSISVVFFLSWVGGEQTTLIVGVLAAVSAIIFSITAKSRKKVIMSAGFVVLALSILWVNESMQIFSIPTDPHANKDLPIFLRENPGSHIVKTKWNSFSRIDVVEGITGNCIPSVDTRNPTQCGHESLVAKIFIDGGAGTNIIPWDGNPESRKKLSTWMQYLPFSIKNDPKVLIIGSGGGRDVVAAIASGSTDVTTVEINPIIFQTVRDYGELAGNVYDHKYVHANVDEGRSFVSKSHDKFDIIYIPFVDTWASVSSGGLGVSENFLYTKEGFQEYYNHLSEDGKIVAVRWLIDSPRFVTTFTQLLEANGVPRNEVYKHIIIVSSTSTTKDPSATMAILSKTPFTESEISFLYDPITKYGYKPMLVPGKVMLDQYKPLLEGSVSLEEFSNNYWTKVYPVSDDSPFFLSFEKPIPKILEVLVYISVAIVVAFLTIPFVWLRKIKKTHELKTAHAATYFAALGTGFILIELTLLQKLILLLGNPTMTFAILLFTVLLSSGFGSFASTKIVNHKIKNLKFVFIGIIALGLIYSTILPTVIYSTISGEFFTKIAVSMALIAPIGFLMGMPLPSGMRILKTHLADHIPWMWSINGAFSVFGAILSVTIGIMYGAKYAMMLGIFSYAIALGITYLWRKTPNLESKISN